MNIGVCSPCLYFQCEVVEMVEAGSFKGNQGEVPFDSKPRVQPPVDSCPKALVPGQPQLGQSLPLQALSLGERSIPGCYW